MDGSMEQSPLTEQFKIFNNTCSNNGDSAPAEDDLISSNEGSGIDETEFQTMREESEKLFARSVEGSDQRMSFSLQDLLDTLTAKKVSRADSLSEVDLDPVTNQLHLRLDKTNIRPRFGYDVGRQAFLYPEEALFLLELGRIQIFSNHVSLSVQRARSRLLISERPNAVDKLAHCTAGEYLVYKDLSQKNYCLYRFRQNDVFESMTNSSGSCRSSSVSHPNEEQVGLDRIDMDQDIILEDFKGEDSSDMDDIIELEPSNGSAERKSIKRKRQVSMSEDEMSDEVMEDTEGIQGSEDVSYLTNFAGDRFTSYQVEPGGYTVDEADSDVEIVDEVINSYAGVEIQEIGHSSGCQEDTMEDSEPVPSTSKGPPPQAQVVVDLVSSDEEEEELRSYGNKIWSKFVPNSKLYVKIPPHMLIPESIPSKDNVYEYDLKDRNDLSDLELEFLVDEVSLNDDTSGRQNSDTNSWKEWRQNIFREARDVMNESLLASSDYINGAAASDKLLLWEDNKMESSKQVPFLNEITFVVYGPAKSGFSRFNAFQGKPLYYISILRESETIPDLKSIGSSINGVPIINAIVCDSSDVIYMRGENSPLSSLF